MTNNFAADVLVCDARTAGRTLAIGLARRNVSFRLIEKMPKPFHGSRGKGIQPRTQEVFEDLGILDKVVAAGGASPLMRDNRPDGSFLEKDFGEVIGVLPRRLVTREIEHCGLTELHLVESMHERKALMAAMSDAFAVMPGGIGTLEEAFEAWTWPQLGFQSKAIGLLNVDGFFDLLNSFLEKLVAEQFLKAVHRGILLCESSAETLIDKLTTAHVPAVPKWIDGVRP